jgi:hypothetical protein
LLLGIRWNLTPHFDLLSHYELTTTFMATKLEQDAADALAGYEDLTRRREAVTAVPDKPNFSSERKAKNGNANRNTGTATDPLEATG